MRYALAAVAIFLCGCGGGGGGGHHAAANPYARIEGTWSATCTASSGDYASIGVGALATFSVNNTGTLGGTLSTGSADIQLMIFPNGPSAFSGERGIGINRVEDLVIHLDTTPPTAVITDDTGSVEWTIAFVHGLG